MRLVKFFEDYLFPQKAALRDRYVKVCRRKYELNYFWSLNLYSDYSQALDECIEELEQISVQSDKYPTLQNSIELKLSQLRFRKQELNSLMLRKLHG